MSAEKKNSQKDEKRVTSFESNCLKLAGLTYDLKPKSGIFRLPKSFMFVIIVKIFLTIITKLMSRTLSTVYAVLLCFLMFPLLCYDACPAHERWANVSGERKQDGECRFW